MIGSGTSTPVRTGVPIDPANDSDPTPILACVPDDPALWNRIGEVYRRFASNTRPGCVPAEGSVAGVCLACECKIWIGPSQQRHPDLHTLCLVCALPMVVEGSEVLALAADDSPKDGMNLEGGNP